MIVGSGLLAKGFLRSFGDRTDVCMFASGVSDSRSVDADSFERERNALESALEAHRLVQRFVYFGTCSVYEVGDAATPYKTHKLAMEKKVLSHEGGIVFRLPQIAGRSQNQATLLNHLSTHILLGKSISVWRYAERNIIDIEDIVRIASVFIDQGVDSGIYNIANSSNIGMEDLVDILSNILSTQPILTLLDKGGPCPINVDPMLDLLADAGVEFGGDYLYRILSKYYTVGAIRGSMRGHGGDRWQSS
jgi:nucleoside-diphosphate-sugar epimerase